MQLSSYSLLLLPISSNNTNGVRSELRLNGSRDILRS
jgi:hypothetical protein